MMLVCNTGPLIALAKLDRLALLPRLGFQRVCIPPRVHREVWGKIGPENVAIETALKSFIQVAAPHSLSSLIENAITDLDEGEQEVIALGASALGEVVLLMDDQAGRRVARVLGLSVVGTAGILLMAKRRGLINAVTPLIAELRRQGYWLSDALLTEVKRLAGE